MAKVDITCACCGSAAQKEASAVNRSRRRGDAIYCGRECAGIARRNGKSLEQKRAEKARYDAEYRQKNADAIKRKKALYYQKTKDPVKEADRRKKRAHLHAEYCRRPEYREWKREYDRRYRAKKNYGEWADCFLLMQDVRVECLSQQTDYEIRLAAGTLNKSIKRRRDFERFNRNSPETGPLGDIEKC